ncbi:MAG: hypothetical protein H0U71_08395 [Gammaproteobacteria bacterium]|nr:hypothetical protein [Gammaproteobacteria bacterium]
MQAISQRMFFYSSLLLAIYGTFWLIGGLFYAYVGSNVVFPLQTFLSSSTTTIQAFFTLSKPFANIYVLIFSLFALADLSLVLIGGVFYYLFRDSYKGVIILLCLLIGGGFGTIVDIFLLSYWHVIWAVLPNGSVNTLLPFWNSLGVIEYFTIWLSAAGFLMGTLGYYSIYSVAQEKQVFSKSWRYLTLFSTFLSGLSVIAIILSLFGASDLFIGILFFIATVIISPLWSYWTIFELKKL